MTSVSAGELGKRVIELLAIHPGEAIELSKLRNGAVLLSKPDEAEVRAPGAKP